jgi:ABC-type Fe3+-hydroxamate transport system substrate-binding protein
VRVVSLVPSLTELTAALGRADGLVGVTTYCVSGAPAAAVRVGGTKNPDREAVLALRPDLVLANTEENRPADLDGMRAGGVEVLETYPRSVAGARAMVQRVAGRLGADPSVIVADIDRAAADAAARRPRTPIATLLLVWRKPWMGAGPGTYLDAMLGDCGFANVLVGHADPWPRLDPALVLRPEVVLLPSEPYAFGEADLPAVRAWLGPVPHRFCDGRDLTWHGTRTAAGLRLLTSLAEDVARELAATCGQ